MMSKSTYNTILVILVVGAVLIIGIFYVGIELEQIKIELKDNHFLTYTKTTHILHNYTLYSLGDTGIFVQVGDEMRPQYYFDFTDGSHGFFAGTSPYTNPIFPDVLEPGYYNITYSTKTFGDDPLLLNIEKVK